MTHIVCERAI